MALPRQEGGLQGTQGAHQGMGLAGALGWDVAWPRQHCQGAVPSVGRSAASSRRFQTLGCPRLGTGAHTCVLHSKAGRAGRDAVPCTPAEGHLVLVANRTSLKSSCAHLRAPGTALAAESPPWARTGGAQHGN